MNIDKLADEILGNVDKVKNVDNKVNKYSLPSRGRKQCPKCSAFVGVRLRVCECGHKFVKGEVHSTPQSATGQNAKYDEPITDEDKRYAMSVGLSQGCIMIYAGAGKCPAVFRPVNPDLTPRNPVDVIRDFCDDIVTSGKPDKKLYMPSAIKGWLAGFIDRNEKPELFNVVDDWYNEQVQLTMVEE